MSDRDDIDVVKTAEKNSADDTIRQNYPIDDTENGTKKKLGFLNMVKKMLSTDEDPEAESSESVSEDDNMFGSLIGRLKKPSEKSGEAPSSESFDSDTPNDKQTFDNIAAENSKPKQAEKPQPEKENDSAEEEELLMIDAFLSGEEYTPEKKEEEPDLSGAFEEEEVVFVDFDTDDDVQEVSGDDTPESKDETEPAETSGEADSAAEDSVLTEKTRLAEQADNSEGEAAEVSDEEKSDPEAALEKQVESEDIENADASEKPNDADSSKSDGEAAEIEEDEEFVLEEEKPFDEEDDLSAHAEESDDFSDLSTIFEDDEEKLEKKEKEPDTKEYEAEPIDIDNGESGEDPESDIAEDDSDKAEETEKSEETSDNKAEDKTEEKTEDKTEEKSDEKSEERSEEPSAEKEEKEEEQGKSEAKTEEKPEDKPQEKLEEPASEEAKTDNESVDDKASEEKEPEKNPANGAKVFFGRVKSKLAELWNAKNEQENAADNNTEDPFISELISDTNTEEKTETASEDTAQANSEEKSEEKPAEASEEKPSEEKSEENTDKKPEEEQKAEADEQKPLEGAAVDAPSEKTQKDTETDASEETKSEAASENDGAEDEKDDKTDEDQTERKVPMISVIKNENVTKTEFDEEKLRGSLNVIERKATDVLTDEQRREIEQSKRELEKVSELEEKATAEREELRREKELRKAKEAEAARSIVTELDVGGYRPEDRKNSIKFPTGKFSDSVRAEYECIVNYNRMISVSTDENLIKEIKKVEAESSTPAEQPKKEAEAVAESGESSANEILKEARDYERNHDKVESLGNKLDYQDKKNPEPVEYRTETDDAEVKSYLTNRRKSDFLTFGITAGLTAAAFIFSLFAAKFTVGAGTSAAAGPQRIFALINLLLYAGAVFFCKDMIISGLMPLKKFKATPDTGVALASAAAALQSLLALITPKPFMTQGLNVYTLVVMLALTLFTAGRYLNSDRALSNFRFVSDSEQKYAGKFFTDARTVAKLLSGTKNEKTEFSFQKKTAFLSHFVRLSNAEDPGDKLAASFSLAALIAAVFAALIAGIMSKSFFDAISVICIMLCAGIPISSRTLGSWPLRKLAKRALVNKSMVVGYPAVETFSESAAVMIDAKDLYPAGSIEITRSIKYDSIHWQNGIYAAAAVTLAAGGAVSGVFEQLVKDNGQFSIPTAEGVMYEDNKGLLGWVNGVRVLVGNRQLLLSHVVPVVSEGQDDEYKANGDEPLYIAYGQKLVAVITVRYSASRRVSDTLKRMEASGMSLLVRTTDANITAERISKDFGVRNQNIKVLEQKVFNYIRDEMVGKERTSPAYIATKGGVTSFGLAVSECVQTKRDISLSTAVEIAGTLIKMLIICAIVLFAGIHQIGAVQLFIFSLMWAAVVLCAPALVQKVQGAKH